MSKIYFRNNKTINWLRFHGTKKMKTTLASITSDFTKLEKLAANDFNSEFDPLLFSIINNNSTPVNVLVKLYQRHGTAWHNLCYAIARHPKTPHEILAEIDKKMSSPNSLDEEIHKNPSVSKIIRHIESAQVTIDELESYAKHFLWHFRITVARNPITPPDILNSLAGDEKFNVRLTLAGNPNTPNQALSKLVDEKNPFISGRLAERADISNDFLLKIAEIDSESVIITILNKEKVDVSVLEIIAQNNKPQVQLWLVESPHYLALEISTKIGLLENLLKYWQEWQHLESSSRELKAVITRINDPAIPLQALGDLSNKYDIKAIEESSKLKAIIEKARDKNTSLEDLRKLAKNPYLCVQKAIVGNLMTPPETLREIIEDNIFFKFHYLKKSAPKKLSAHYVYSSEEILYSVAENPKIPQDILATLASNPHSTMWRRLTKNSSCPAKIVAKLIKIHLPKSIPEQEDISARDGYYETTYHTEDGWADPDPITTWVDDPSPAIEGHPAAYTEDDYKMAAEIINRHPQEKKALILSELKKLNPELSSAIRNYVKLK